jgi:hypothetical protein
MFSYVVRAALGFIYALPHHLYLCSHLSFVSCSPFLLLQSRSCRVSALCGARVSVMPGHFAMVAKDALASNITMMLCD